MIVIAVHTPGLPDSIHSNDLTCCHECRSLCLAWFARWDIDIVSPYRCCQCINHLPCAMCLLCSYRASTGKDK